MQQAEDDRTLLISSETLRDRVCELGKQITKDYQGAPLVLIGILNGAFMFTSDLCRAIDLDVGIDFIRVASYGDATKSSGTIRMSMDYRLNVQDKDVLLVEDIVDTGITMVWLKEHFRNSGARSVKICALINKDERRKADIDVDYTGFDIAQGFLVGYGLDCGERYRNLPAVYALRP